MRHQHGIFALVSQTFCGKTVGGMVKINVFCFLRLSWSWMIFSAFKQNNYYSSWKELNGTPVPHKVFLELPLSSTLTRPDMWLTTMLFFPCMINISCETNWYLVGLGLGVFLALSLWRPITSNHINKAVLAGGRVCMSLVWILKPFISSIEKEALFLLV